MIKAEEWPPRFMAEMTPAEAGKFLRNLCEMTVNGSGDWDNMQEIFTQFLSDAYKGGAAKTSAERDAYALDAKRLREALAAVVAMDDSDDPGLWGYESYFEAARAALAAQGETK